MKLVIIESPYAGDVAKNIEYARAAMRDSLKRGEAPMASHLLYTQPGILDDDLMGERLLGIKAGFAWSTRADLTAVYADLGISDGMKIGIRTAEINGRPIEYRSLTGQTTGPSA